MASAINVNEHKKKQVLCWLFALTNNRIVAGVLLTHVYFIYSLGIDMAGSMEIITEDTFSLRPYQFEYMYSLYSLPNIILCLCNGVLVDKVFGLQLGSILFALVCLIGQTVLTVGNFVKLYWIVLFGRFLYGIGSESLIVTLNSYCTYWFKDKEIHFIFGLVISFARLGSSAAFMISSACLKSFDKSVALGYTSIPFLFAILCQLILIIVLGWYSRFSGMKESKAMEMGRSIEFKHILNFPKGYWLIVAMFSICSNTLYSFISCSQEFLRLKYDLTPQDADQMSSFFNFSASVIPVLSGFIGDKLGRNLFFISLALMVGILSQVCFIVFNLSPYIPLCLYSISLSVMCTFSWPLITFAVEPFQIASAYGILECLINLFGTIMPLVVGYLLGTYGPIALSWFFLSCLTLGLFCIVLIHCFDQQGSQILNMSGQHRKESIENLDRT